MTRAKIFALLIAMSLASPALAGSLYLTGHDILDHDGQNGYWRVIVDYLRGEGTGLEIFEADYDIAVLCPGDCTNDMTLPSAMGWTGPETHHDAGTLDDAGWAVVFSKDLVLVVESSKIGAAGRAALNGKKAELEAFFNAGGDLWMNTNNGDSDYYTVLPASVLSTGSAISTNTGFSPTAAGVAIGLVDNMVNGHQSHNVFTTAAPQLIVFELFQATEIMSIGIRDATISELSDTIALPALSTWALLLLVLLVTGLAYPTLRAKRIHNG